METLLASLSEGVFSPFLLEGVTGSGKTEVYLRVIEEVLAEGRSAVMLVPEIALTPQMISRFRCRFAAGDIALLHSGLTRGERHDEWWRIRRGEARVVIGARSAVFAPVRNLGLIVVDEEQDHAYKQDHGFMYHGRDLALMRAKMEGAVAVLGSATPSLESAFRARMEEGGYGLLRLTRRVVDRPLPKVEIVDLRDNKESAQPAHDDGTIQGVRDRDRIEAEQLISPPLRDAIEQNLERGEQTILFLNRRGISSFLTCFDCGSLIKCADCEVTMTHHGKAPRAGKIGELYAAAYSEGFLLCHYCGAHMPVPEVCPKCRGVRLFRFGVGTEKMEAAVAALFPAARVERMDSDVMSGRESYFRVIERASKGEIDILVGTQMVAKGHDLPGVTLVGVLLADLSLEVADFRAAERTFHMLTQVAGRAGRGEKPGRVIVQTMQPKHHAVELALAQDFETFYEKEIASRMMFFYPPFARLANIRVSGEDAALVERTARQLGNPWKRTAGLKDFRDKVRILGPSRAPISRIKGRTRWMMLVKADAPVTMGRFLDSALARSADAMPGKSIRVEIDRDPAFII